VDLEEFSAVRPSGMIAMSLNEGDELGWARLTTGKNDVILVTELGQALRIPEKVVRSMGRTAGGVQGIRLGEEDRVTSMEVVEEGAALLTVTKGGFGKQTPLAKYPVKGRGTKGISTMDHKAIGVTGRIASARVVQPSDDLTLISANGIVLRLKVKEIREAGRATRGVRVMRLQEGDAVAAVARIASADLKKAGADTDGEVVAEKDQPSLI
jgi:DNA gyrase subunit A